MKLELLPNEILLDVFNYFDGTDLLRAFYGLNSRFNFLLYKQFRSYRFQFRYLSKRLFDLICKQHLPFVANQVITLNLCDEMETPDQIKLFFSYTRSIRQFTHLRSMTFYHLDSYKILLKLLNQCQHLCNFTHLHFYSCNLSKSSADCQLIVDKIWSLPKLTNCHFEIRINREPVFRLPTIVSRSLQYLTISDHRLNLNHLFDYAPHLKRLQTRISNLTYNDHIDSPILTLTSLRIFCNFSLDISISNLFVFFKNMPNLHHLDIYIWWCLINGHQWKQIIQNHLPQLKTFRCEMKMSFNEDENVAQRVNMLIDSFRSSFWIDEHRWYVRCFTHRKNIYLSTSSKLMFHGRVYPESWQSTYPHDSLQEFYNSLTNIYNETFFDQSFPTDVHLSNIKYLHIQLPINDQFWSIVSSLNQLKTLSISSCADIFQFQLQSLLARESRLLQPNIRQDELLPMQISIFDYTNTFIRKLDLHDCDYYFNEQECLLSSHLPLIVQCEVLSIWVTNRRCIISLIKNIPDLRSLTVKCKDEEYAKQTLSKNRNNDLVLWLKDRLLSTSLIIRHPKMATHVLIWM